MARIALYPDELVAVISGASLFPLQIVEASRFLDKAAKDKNLKPKDTWDGSVISLLNYPEIVTMMSDDLEWTQTLGDALTYQQKDVLIAIQQLRDKAVAAGVIKSDDKMTVVAGERQRRHPVGERRNVYVPQYEPQMLYEPNYPDGADQLLPRPLSELPLPDGDVLRGSRDRRPLGRRDGLGQLGRLGRPLGWRRRRYRLQQLLEQHQRQGQLQRCRLEERRPLEDQLRQEIKFNKIDRTAMRDRVKADGSNSLRNQGRRYQDRDRPRRASGRIRQGVRCPQVEDRQGLRAKPGDLAANRPGAKNTARASSGGNRPDCQERLEQVDRPVGKPRPAAKADNRPRQPSGLGTVEVGQARAGRFPPRRPGYGRRPARRRPAACQRRWRAVAVAVGVAGRWRRRRSALNGRERMMIMTTSVWTFALRSMFAAAIMLAANLAHATVAAAEEATSLSDYASPNDPPIFDTPAAAVDAFKSALASDDFDALATLLGLDAAKLKGAEGVMDTYAKIREGAARKVVVRDLGDRQFIDIGDELWTFPFPVAKGDDGKWSFDTYAGLEEIINRRVGENELQAIETMRAYVEAQRDYAAEDRDADGVLEYAQKLLSSEGQTDGLYWPTDDVNGVSPAGDLVTDQAAVDKAKAGDGYFGYRFRILTGQGDNVAGGAYDYVINGNMIAGFALIAWPVKYAETGVHTFMVSHQGIVYQADLGADTEKLAAGIKRFNPDDDWEVTGD